MQWWPDVKHIHRSDRLILHSAALLCFITPCATSHNVEIERVCLRQRNAFDLSVCQYVDGNQGCIFSRLFLNDLSTCWAFQKCFYFDLHQQGMEWSRLGLSPLEPLWTHQSRAPVQRWDATALIYYLEVIHHPWIKKTIELCCWSSQGWAEHFRTDDLRDLRRRDKRDRPTDMSDPSDCLWRLPVSLISSVSMKNRDGRVFCTRGWYLLRCLQKAEGQSWELRGHNCGQMCISSFSQNEIGKWSS